MNPFKRASYNIIDNLTMMSRFSSNATEPIRALIVPFRALRLHDNPLLEIAIKENALMLYCVDLSRIPLSDPYDEPLNSKKYSISQAWFYLNCMALHIDDLERCDLRVALELTDDVSKTINGYMANTRAQEIYTEYMHDPKNDYIADIESENITQIEVVSMLDWHATSHMQMGKDAFARPYAKTGRLKKHIHSNCPPIHDSERNLSFQSEKRPKLSSKLFEIIDRLKTLATSCGVQLYPIDTIAREQPFDRAVLMFAEKSANMIKERWKKPFTKYNLGLYEYAQKPILQGGARGKGGQTRRRKRSGARTLDAGFKDMDMRDNSSKLSPFLSIGVLSPRKLYSLLGNGLLPVLGSAADQLLFRECWYAAAVSVPDNGFWNDDSTWWKSSEGRGCGNIGSKPKNSSLIASWKGLKKTNSIVSEWILGEMNDEWVDANQSMQELWVNGWIHHMRRHVVADVLCRGQLKQHFIYGELWFRRTLIDHDAVINRANWLWLSTAAFSTAQCSGRNYNPSDYIKRHSVSNGPRSRVKTHIISLQDFVGQLN